MVRNVLFRIFKVSDKFEFFILFEIFFKEKFKVSLYVLVFGIKSNFFLFLLKDILMYFSVW